MNQQLIDNNYLHIPNFISKEEANSLASELIEYSKLPGNTMTNDPLLPNALYKYNYLPFLKFLVKKMSHASKILQEDILPTYAITRIHGHNSCLYKHVDRPACEISLSINLKKDADWPFFLLKPNGEEISVELNQGDAVMYLGTTAFHWRDAYQGQEHVQLVLHYVRAEGSKYWAVFDQLKQQPPTLEKGIIPVAVI